MKVSREKLQQIIQEELQEMVDEGEIDEGFFDRDSGVAASRRAGIAGFANRLAVGAKGAVKQGAMGLAQKGLGALGSLGATSATNAAGEIGAAKEKLKADTQAQQQNIKAATAAKQTSAKFNAAITPKVVDIEKDMKILFGDKPPPEMQQVTAALQQLKAAVQAVAGKIQPAAQPAAQPAVAESKKRTK